MNAKRAGAIVLGGGALAAWLAGAATSNRALPDPIVARPARVDARGADLANEIARLHERLRPAATPRTPARNLFAFRAAPAPAAPSTPVEAPRAALVETPIAPALPPLKLAGIGEDPGPDGPVRIAFVSSDTQLFIVKVGELLTPRYRVAAISADVVELVDLQDNGTRRLTMR